MLNRSQLARCIAFAFALEAAGCGLHTAPEPELARTETAVHVASLDELPARASQAGAKKRKRPKKPKKPRSDSPEPALPVTASLVLTGAPAIGVPSQTSAEFSITDVRELFLYAVWSNLEGEHTQLFKLYSPDGEVYYQKLSAFSTLIESPRAFTTRRDVPHAQTMQPVVPEADGRLVVRDYIGLAGSEIADHGMTGAWQVELYLDDSLIPIASSGFSLTN